MPSIENTQARRAALLVHSLSPDAQRKVMAGLPAADAGRLRTLIDELIALGVSQSLGHKLHDVAATWSPQTVPAGTAASAVERARHLAAEDVAASLQACAASLVAQLLRSGEWPWRHEVLHLMSETRLAEVLQHLRRDAPKLAPATLNSLCSGLCARAGEARAKRLHIEAAKAQGTPRGWREAPRTVVTWLRGALRWP